MSWEQRTKYIQRGSGQAFYLYQEDPSRKWIIAMFIGGPDGVLPAGNYSTREEAEQALTKMSCELPSN